MEKWWGNTALACHQAKLRVCTQHAPELQRMRCSWAAEDEVLLLSVIGWSLVQYVPLW